MICKQKSKITKTIISPQIEFSPEAMRRVKPRRKFHFNPKRHFRKTQNHNQEYVKVSRSKVEINR